MDGQTDGVRMGRTQAAREVLLRTSQTGVCLLASRGHGYRRLRRYGLGGLFAYS